jgi:hydroxymethylpyrimidine pyrophosphatase-like HAD family hydrolase
MSPLREIRLVVLDLDGTLLPSTKVLTPRARRVVGELRDSGRHVTLATGKGWSLTERYAQELGIDEPCVALEGALVSRPGGPPLRRLTLSPEQRAEAHRVVADLDLGWFFTHDGSQILASRHMEPKLPELRIWDPDVEITDARLDDPSLGPAHVLHFVAEPPAVALAHDRLRALDLPRVELFHNQFWDGLDQVQVRPEGIGKHRGLESVLTELAVGADEMLACGDWWNDRPTGSRASATPPTTWSPARATTTP